MDSLVRERSSDPQSQKESVRSGRIQSFVRFILGKGNAMKLWKVSLSSGNAASYQVSPDEIEIPEPTRVSGGYAEGRVFNKNPAGPTRAEIEDRALVDAARAVKDPWAGDTPPPLYSSRPSSRK